MYDRRGAFSAAGVFATLGAAMGCGGFSDLGDGVAPSASTLTTASPRTPTQAMAEPPEKLTAEQVARRERLFHAAAASVPGGSGERALSPYFFVDSDDPSTDALPLKSTRVAAQIAGSIADLRVIQVYRNEGTRTLEAVYIFPASTRAAIHAMKMTIGQRVIEASIREKETARKEYEAARAEGRTASLLEQQRPNVFQMNVANILPGDEIKVELSYAELLVPESHLYELVYPTVVGPRYSNQKESAAPESEQWVKNPHLRAGKAAPHEFSFDAVIRSGVPIRQLTSPSHAVRIEYPDARTAHVALDASREGGNRDLILKYALEGDEIESGLLLYPGESGSSGQGDGYFLLMMEPPRRVAARDIVPREYIFIVDVSGSMHGFPLETTRNLMQRLFGGLRPQDHFNILTFSGGNELLAPSSLPATQENVRRAMAMMARLEAGGGTELLPALQRAMALPRTAGASRVVAVVTDGYVQVEKEAFALVRRELGRANVFSFGIGSSVNRFLIEGLARAGMGEPFLITGPESAQARAEAFQEYVLSPVLQGVEVKFEGFGAYDVEPVALPDLFADRPVVVHGRYRGNPAGKIVISGHVPGGAFAQTLDVASANASPDNVALRTLWARQKIQRLADLATAGETEEHRAEITALGLQHHLMTDYTSFVAIDTQVRADGRKTQTVRQPLPLPAGVSDEAVGMGGLGIMGTGRGGGGTGQGTIGLGHLGTIGRGMSGAAMGSGVGYGRGSGGLAGRSAMVPNVAPGAAVVMGSLDKEIIRRVIRRHLNEVRFVYEKELLKNPRLKGGIVIRFVIQADGTVLSATVVSSTMGNKSVEAGVAAAIKRWTFPKPGGGGVVSVIYPFAFLPSGSGRR